jgi:2-phosphoglycerate kinase
MNDRRPPESTLIAPDAQEQLEALSALDLPLIVLVGGATGTGKSTVATEVAHRLGITRVTSTDVVRQTMRAFFSHEFMPAIHPSSFEAGEAVRGQSADEDEADLNLRGFLEQTRNVLVGVRAVLGRAIEEGYSLVLEGVHLVPGALPATIEGAVVCQYLLAIEDEDEHASHFWTRDNASEGVRPFEKYLRALPEIRRIQEYLVERAGRTGVPVIQNSDVDATVGQVIRHVLTAVEGALPDA